MTTGFALRILGALSSASICDVRWRTDRLGSSSMSHACSQARFAPTRLDCAHRCNAPRGKMVAQPIQRYRRPAEIDCRVEARHDMKNLKRLHLPANETVILHARLGSCPAQPLAGGSRYP